MLDELKKELEMGRLQGPFCSPAWWPRPAIGIEGSPMLPSPEGIMTAAFSFSVCQHQKIRRCEDHRRSLHNATVQVADVPPHEDITVYANVAKTFMNEGLPTASWAQDLNAAYRQFPVRSTDHTYTILCCPDGPVVFRHCALSFGSTASVWAFNRTADAVCHLTRRILWSPVCHYVDDFGCVESSTTIQSSYANFERLFGALGLRMKPSKAQPPNQVQKLLGVSFKTSAGAITLQPHPDRVEKIKDMISECLSSDQMSPELAQKLAGKMVFLTTTVFGQLGRGLLSPLYGRAHHPESSGKVSLTNALRVSLNGLLQICRDMQPRVIPTQVSTLTAVIYTDAFFTLGDKQFRVGSPDIPTWWDHRTIHQAENGWGFIVRINDKVFFSHGVVPSKVLRLFCRRRAFIYFLEIVAQMICLTVMKDTLPALVISFCDNQAGLAALQKGMGRDENINRLLITTWQLIAAKQWHIHMEWVASHNNLSDRISRHDTSWVNYSEWTELTPDLTQFYKILCRIAQDETYAVHQAKSDLLQLDPMANLSNCFTNDCIGRVGEGGPKMVRKGPPCAMTSDAASTQPWQKEARPAVHLKQL